MSLKSYPSFDFSWNCFKSYFFFISNLHYLINASCPMHGSKWIGRGGGGLEITYVVYFSCHWCLKKSTNYTRARIWGGGVILDFAMWITPPHVRIYRGPDPFKIQISLNYIIKLPKICPDSPSQPGKLKSPSPPPEKKIWIRARYMYLYLLYNAHPWVENKLF